MILIRNALKIFARAQKRNIGMPSYGFVILASFIVNVRL